MGGHGTSSALSAFWLLFIVLQFFSPAYSQRSDCRTPVRQDGNCIELSQCNELLKLLETRHPDSYDYLRQSQCGFRGGNPMVCCPTRTTPTRPGGTQVGSGDNTEDPWTSGSTNGGDWDLRNPLLPQICGEDLSQRIVGGEKADIYEFPWMGLLEYNKPGGKTTACGGVLISKRYVLTAAHCVKGKDLPKTWTLANVRLGEYDTSTDRDCVPDGDGSTFCTADPVTVGIEEQIVHEGYRPQSRDQVNDIALLRLNRDVAFTNFVRPICLPPNAPLNDRFLHVAGWGKTETRSESTVKLKLKIPIADNAVCANAYQSVSIQIGDSQLCAGGERGRDTCRGDSGGPLMSVKRTEEDKLRWTVIGVVSLGPSPCGVENWPGIYTKVTSFVPWILSKMRN